MHQKKMQLFLRLVLFNEDHAVKLHTVCILTKQMQEEISC